MKKNIFVIALAAIALCFSSCEKTPITTEEFQPTPRVATTSDLTGTSWTANLPLEDLLFAMTGMNFDDYSIQLSEGLDANLVFHLNFGDEYAHITFSDNIEMWQMVEADGEYTMEQIEQMDLAYEYNGGTYTGSLTAVGMDENGDPIDYEITFTYDVANDTITINFVFSNEEENIVSFPLNFQRDELVG